MDENSYHPPLFTDLPTLGVDDGNRVQTSVPSEAEIRAFVGKKADYYLRKWHAPLHDSRPARSFNWAAFFLSGFWLPYRKMYRVTLILLGIIVAVALVLEVLVAVGFTSEQSMSALSNLFGPGVSILCGFRANAWYFEHTKRQIARIRAMGLKDDAYFEALARRGGTSLLASLGFFVLLMLGLFLVLFVIVFLDAWAKIGK